MGIPVKYRYLSTLGLLPRVITYALAEMGTVEKVGKGSNPVILSWRDELNKAKPGSIKGYSDDDIPWCGLFAAIITQRSGKGFVTDPLWAQNWKNFGVEVARNIGTTVKPKLQFAPGMKASLGDILVYVRDGGGHVNFYVGEDATTYHGVGGNQSNSVSITRITKDRCIAVRRPPMNVPPASMKPYWINASGEISKNEG